MVWPDVLAVLEQARVLRPDGYDEAGRDKWLVGGPAADGLDIELVCALDHHEPTTVFITLYWE